MKPRLLIDENFPSPSVARLIAAGYDLVYIAENNAGIDDTAVLLQAVREERWLVTFDRDYGELLFVRNLPLPPAIILFRVQSYRPEEPAEWLMRLIRNPDFHLGKFIVFDGDTIRSRPFPRQVGGGTD